jgi:uncharacterized protein
MVYLITGASGFIGRHCCQLLIEKGYSVKAIIRSEDIFLNHLGVDCFVSDLWNDIIYESVLDGVNIVIHCAGDASFGNGLNYIKQNSELTNFILINIEKYNQNLERFIYISSIGAVDRKWGDNCRKELNENSNCFPSSDYGRSKLEAEEIVKKSTIPFSIIRPSMVVGSDMRLNSHFSVFIRSVTNNSLFSKVAWPGSFSVVHVDDLVNAILIISLNPESSQKTYFCAGSKISIAECFKYCAPKKWRIGIAWLKVLFSPLILYLPFKIKALFLPTLVASDKNLQKIGWKLKYNGVDTLKSLVKREKSRSNFNIDPGGQIVITGAASGLGRAFFSYLVKIRKNIILIDKDLEALKKIKNAYPDIKIVGCDLSTPKEIDTLLNNELSNEYISELYLCAGIGSKGLVRDLGFDAQSKIVELNFLSRLKLALFSYNSMRINQLGRIVFVSSSTAFQPMPFMAIYSAQNSALLSLGRAWSQESRRDGVNIHTLCPGGMNTNFQSSSGVRKIEGETLLDTKYVVKKSIKGIMNNKSVIIISLRSKMMDVFSRIVPRFLSDKIWYKMMAKLR